MSLEEGYRETKASSSLIWAGAIPICTGTATTELGERVLVSAGHCLTEVKNLDRFYVERNSLTQRGVKVELLREKYFGPERWKEGDFALFRLPQESKLRSVPVCKELPRTGEEVWSWAGPAGIEPVLLSGKFSGVVNFPANPRRPANGLLVVSFSVQKGASGAGVFKMEGGKPCVWGVVAGRPEEIPGISYIYPIISDIKSLP